jgi:HEAT repeat protein
VLSLGTKLPDADAAWGLSSAEWQLYLESLPLPASLELCRGLDARFGLTSLGNHEVLVAWLCVALGSGYDAVLPRALDLLGEVGRMRYLKPLYRCLLDRPETAPRAREAFAQHAAGYHPIARAVLQAMMS